MAIWQVTSHSIERDTKPVGVTSTYQYENKIKTYIPVNINDLDTDHIYSMTLRPRYSTEHSRR